MAEINISEGNQDGTIHTNNDKTNVLIASFPRSQAALCNALRENTWEM